MIFLHVTAICIKRADSCYSSNALVFLSAVSLQVDAGVADRLVLGDPKAPRFVYWENKLRATPSGPDILTFDLLSIIGKIRAGLGAVGILKAPAPGMFCGALMIQN
jgi:hypothetical protein